MNLTQKISQMTPKGADLEATDLIEVSTIESGSYVTRSITGQELIDAIPLPPTGLTVGTTPISSGTIGRVLFQGTGNVLQQSSSLFWDNATNLLDVNGNLKISKSTFSSLLAFNSGAFGSSAEYFDLAYPINGGLRYIPNFSGSFDGAAFQCFGGTATSFAGQMYFDYGSNARNISGRSANWRNASLAGFTNVLTLTANSNVLINTTTDAGFRLDVNGTARVSGNVTITGSTTMGTVNIQGSVLYLNQSTAPNSYLFSASTISILNGNNIRLSGGPVCVNEAGANATASSILDVSSTTKGFLPPRMTTTQRNAIASPAAGLVVYDNTDNKHYGYNGTTWNAFY